LMGMALLNPEIAERLLQRDVSLLDEFQFSTTTRYWLLQIQAKSLETFAQALVAKLREQARVLSTHALPEVNITLEYLRQAANVLVVSLKPQANNPLQDLVLVDELLSSPYWPYSPLNRQLALQYLLVQVITDEFTRLCWVFQIPPPDPLPSWESARGTIALIAEKGSSKLVGWSWLFYRYVCSDFDLSMASFAAMVCVDKRTLRRYQRTAFRQLAERLIVLEGRARLRRQTLTHEEIPLPPHIALVR
jgi:hypothetical protein